MNDPATEQSLLRVVIVDDTVDLRHLLRIALQRGGFEVVGEAGDGRAAIEVVAACRPDIVLLDLSMPVMDGMEALPHLRALVPDAKIVVLSGFEASQMGKRAIANGADDYFQKGMALGEVLDRLRALATPNTAPSSAPESAAERPVRALPDPAATARDALALAPYGVIEVDADEPFHLLHVNPAVAGFFAREPEVGRELETVSPEVARMVAHHLGGGRASFAVIVDGRGLHVTVRRATHTLLLYVEAVPEEVEALRRTLATTAHEIRGPMAVLDALAEALLRDDTSGDDERAGLRATLARQARVLDGLTGDLLVAAQFERGALRIEQRPVDPVTAIEAVVADQQAVVDLEVLGRRPVHADPLRLDQMLSNLVRNAVEHGGAPVVVRVLGHADPRHVAIEVQDGGSGVPEDFRDRLFEEFSRASGAVRGGLGLGLHVVRTLAEAHGGTVSYRPAPDGGAVFTLVLPAS
ncbi:MAG TPA: hybrid sensor histidine kinase/response regulator [Marmoricola sp.]